MEPETYERGAAGIAEHTLRRARAGSIILLHVMYKSRSESVRAVPAIVRRLRERGFEFVTVSELMAGR